MKIGIDFGSTYSTFSTVDPVSGELRALTLAEGDPFSIPSVVSIQKRNNQVSCGASAKSKIGKKGFNNFEAFKMLLNEADLGTVAANGYDDKHDPRSISALFLNNCLGTILTRAGQNKIENAVICVPESWGNKTDSLDGRGILLDILNQEVGGKVENARVVTEPEAASAFFAYNYEKETRKAFNGHLLLIDYGGGTLDLTITEITSNGGGSMEIAYCDSDGAGDNHHDKKTSQVADNVIGSAGIAYMRTIAALAMKDSELIDDVSEINYSSPAFMELVKDIESTLKDAFRIREIADYFGGFGKYSKFQECYDEDPEEFAILYYGDDEVFISYQHLFKAYQIAIETVLASTVSDMNMKVKDIIHADPCSPESGMNDDFKIAIVGGFGSCYFVYEQLANIYNIDPNRHADLRFKSISSDKKEVAISYGAALLAADKVKLHKTARYSIGIYCQDSFHYGIHYHQTLQPGVPSYILNDDTKGDVPENRVCYGALKGNIKGFVLEFSDDPNHGMIFPLRQEMLDQMSNVPDIGIWNCGFSMDQSDIVSFHIEPSPRFPMDGNKPIRIPLERYGKLFDMCRPKEVTK